LWGHQLPYSWSVVTERGRSIVNERQQTRRLDRGWPASLRTLELALVEGVRALEARGDALDRQRAQMMARGNGLLSTGWICDCTRSQSRSHRRLLGNFREESKNGG